MTYQKPKISYKTIKENTNLDGYFDDYDEDLEED